jgi:hypothetical protein
LFAVEQVRFEISRGQADKVASTSSPRDSLFVSEPDSNLHNDGAGSRRFLHTAMFSGLKLMLTLDTRDGLYVNFRDIYCGV